MASHGVMTLNARNIATIFGTGLVLGMITNTVIYVVVVVRRRGGLI
jgi:hypothetical protein